MKLIKQYMLGISCLLITGVLFISCKKSFDAKIQTDQDFSNSSIVQVYIATVNAQRNYLYVNGNPVNGGNLMATGSLFPSSGDGFNVPAGVKSFVLADTQVVKIPVTTQLPLVFAQSMDANKKYTVFVYDTITSPKQKTVENNVVVPSDTTARLRLANFVYNNGTIPNVDVFSYNRNANIFTNIAVTDVTGYIPYPSRLNTDTLYIRETGTTVNIFKASIGAGVFTEKRSYTLVIRGSYKGTRTLSLFSSR
jgi:hypothetical protein